MWPGSRAAARQTVTERSRVYYMMSNKRAHADGHSSATASSPSSKMLRDDWYRLLWEGAGVEAHEFYKPGKGFEQQVLFRLKKKEETMDLISDRTTDGELTFWFQMVRFYKGFQLALQFLLETLEKCTQPAVIIHGVPEVGKTCLAHALAYALATKNNEPVYLKMSDEPVDSDVAADNLNKVIINTKWVIADQCDMDAFKFSRLVKGVYTHYNMFKVPIVFVTSGHNPPAPKFHELSQFVVKVVDIQANEEALTCEVPLANPNDIRNVLQVTKHFSRAITLLALYTGLSTEELKEKLTKSFRIIKRDEAYGLFLSCVGEDGSIDEYLTPEFVRTLAFVQKDEKDLRDTGMNGILNFTDICKLKQENDKFSIEELSDDFTSLESNEYAYLVRNPESLKKQVNKYRADLVAKGKDPTFIPLRRAFMLAMSSAGL